MNLIVKKKLLNNAVLKASLMIAGTAIGAGMLAIPLVTAQTGFLSASFTTLFVWLYMLITGILLMEVSTSLKNNGGFLQMAERFLPVYGKEITIILFTFLYGILLVAYISAGYEIFGLNINDHYLVKLLFPIMIFSFLSLKTNKVIALISFFTIPMWVYFILFYVMGAEYIKVNHLASGVYSNAYLAVPVLFGAFGYHNVIPSVSRYLDFDRKKLKLSIFIGSLITCIIYLLWQALILGIVDTKTLEYARENGIPVTIVLSNTINGFSFASIGVIFAFFAIVTSALGVGLSLVEFIDPKQNRKTIFLVVFIPSLIALFNPGIFLKALSFAGGIGESLLNGIIPIAMYYFYKSRLNEISKELKIFTFFLFVIALVVVIIELYNCLKFLL